MILTAKSPAGTFQMVSYVITASPDVEVAVSSPDGRTTEVSIRTDEPERVRRPPRLFDAAAVSAALEKVRLPAAARV